MHALTDPADPADPTHEILRPVPPRTWRDRVDDAVAAGPPVNRLLIGVAALAVVAVVGWRLLAPPAPPPEMEIPFTEAGAAAAPEAGSGPAGTADPGGAATADAVPGGVAPAASGPDGAIQAPGESAGGEVVVHVVGAVTAPGVQRLPQGARVVDAVDAAGGAGPDADLGRINLAAPLIDGQQVYVLRLGEPVPVPPSGPAAGTASGSDGGSDDTGAAAGTAPVDINTASAAQLEELPGVGPTTAAAIIDHREQNGPFASVDDLLDVRGIGEAKLDALRDLATV
jgi:competence protein ComEA